MNRRARIAHYCFLVAISAWIITMLITPVGGWADSNPYHEYYKTAFCVTGIIALITLYISYKMENRDSKDNYVDTIQGTRYDDYTEMK